MAKSRTQPAAVSTVLRRAITKSGRTPYEIAKAAGIGTDALYRFLANPDHALKLDTVDKLAAELGLELRPADRGE